MKGLIILAVTSFLVGVEASSISTFRKELEDIDESKTVELPWMLEELDGTSATGVLDEMHNIKTNVDELRCSGNTCEFREWSAYFKISYLSNSNEFQMRATFKGDNVFDKTIPAKDFKDCKNVDVFFFWSVKACVEIKNVKINGPRACMDLKLSADRFIRNLGNLCLGTSNHWSLA